MAFFVATTIVVCCQNQLIIETPYNAVVSQDGTGNFNTIAGAILAAPDHSVKPFFIKIKRGTYQEYIRVDKKKTNIVLVGEGMDATIITGNRSFVDGNRTYDTATVGVLGDGFLAQDITFRNNAGPIKHQAVALRVEADSVCFYKCRFDGYQDTLYVKKKRQFYRDCEIYGTIDFICGDATTLFQNCLIEARTPMARQYNTVSAQGREFEDVASGIVLQNCTIKATRDLEKSNNVKTYLGRPWGILSRTVIMESYIDNLIDPRGWVEWIESTNKSVVSRRPYYLEYKNRGPGAVTKGRVTWASVTTDPDIASNFTVRQFIKGDEWIPANIPRYLDLS
ncbi:pectinesterase/pectinesterase inhibitor PPE8B-like [Solanum tuberosum]|uniref:Pectinesterase PPE8B n=1 Tax=Solanum tuberosum TaxID=4113 RepID=M1BNP7_SOLTU|nr:PREDICTED: pectinesterase/pectinesterase inhibitor PPE8B-like [Solanum tuberosum]